MRDPNPNFYRDRAAGNADRTSHSDYAVQSQPPIATGGFNFASIIPTKRIVKTPSGNPESEISRALRNHRRARLLRFLALETAAIALVVGSVVAGLSERFGDESLTKVFQVLPIAAAALAVALPILFFGHPKRRGPRL